MPPAWSIWLMTQPPNMSPLAFVSFGIAIRRTVSSPRGASPAEVVIDPPLVLLSSDPDGATRSDQARSETGTSPRAIERKEGRRHAFVDDADRERVGESALLRTSRTITATIPRAGG